MQKLPVGLPTKQEPIELGQVAQIWAAPFQIWRSELTLRGSILIAKPSAKCEPRAKLHNMHSRLRKAAVVACLAPYSTALCCSTLLKKRQRPPRRSHNAANHRRRVFFTPHYAISTLLGNAFCPTAQTMTS